MTLEESLSGKNGFLLQLPHILSRKHERTQHRLAYGSQMGLEEEVNWH